MEGAETGSVSHIHAIDGLHRCCMFSIADVPFEVEKRGIRLPGLRSTAKLPSLIITVSGAAAETGVSVSDALWAATGMTTGVTVGVRHTFQAVVF